ncbi:hypothetical protein TL16_g05075 [Triparma laevis f. inornata]|uniref:Uncharacterized protein n=1 Tax=Triparma laevis f. inornata TaxID=1714386 RepID=A0A9W7E5L6_9STRA|nr:hypothetical protein TL16_g05075 [Triparma laevis f. inornata]
MTPSQKQKYEEFEEFRAAFGRAKVTRMARHKEELSTKDPVPFLHKAYYKEKRTEEVSSDLPFHLSSVVKLQEKSGKWFPSKNLYGAMGGAMPDPPDGLDAWRWCTALAMAFVRRYPEHIDELRDCYKKGLEWTDSRLIEEARAALPPLNPYFELDPKMVKTGNWKKSVQNSFDLGGYQNFIPQSLKDKRKSDDDELQEAIQAEEKRLKEEEERKKLKEIGAARDDRKLKMKYVKQQMERMEEDRKRESRFNKTDAKRAPLLKIEYDKLSRTKDFGELKKRWQSTCKMSDEMQRLKVVEEEKKKKKSWDDRIPAMEASQSKRLALGESVNSKQRHTGPSPLAQAAKERAYARMEAKANKGKKKLTQLEIAIMEVDNVSKSKKRGIKYDAADAQEDLKRNLDRAQANVVEKIIEYEGYIRSIKKTLDRSLSGYRKARVVAARQKSFDELTAMLGMPRAATMGYNDWKGKYIKGLVLTTVELIESVGVWREAVLMAQGKKGQRNEFGELIDHGPPLPFTWNGKNVLLQIPSGMNFLLKCTELVNWFGNDFTFSRNCFMLAVPLDDRPVTPIVATREVMVDGVAIKQVSSSMAKEAEQQQAYFDYCENVTSQGGLWWPSSGGKDLNVDLKRRVRAAEKVLILEEAVCGRM